MFTNRPSGPDWTLNLPLGACRRRQRRHRGLRSVGARLESEKIAALASDQNSILDADDIANEHRQRLKESLVTLRGKRDLVIIDTPPDLGFEMTTALIASDWFVIPVFPSGYDLKGLETLARTVEKIRKRYNPNLRLAGVLLGNYDKTAKLDADIHKALVKKFGEDLVFRTTIARSVKHRESTLYRKTIFEHAPNDQASIQYADLVKEMINRGAKGAFGATLNPLPDETALERPEFRAKINGEPCDALLLTGAVPTSGLSLKRAAFFCSQTLTSRARALFWPGEFWADYCSEDSGKSAATGKLAPL